MDYQAFYTEVANWINECNNKAMAFGMHSNEFWSWVMRSTGEMSNKYGNNDLVKKQMIMLVDWLKEIYERMNNRGS
ncbi:MULTISPECIES: hypothetical protein [Clostridia]|uniref:hypothetical protein n=1 Tax=Clostridia TaxID=186801 RepID=UPI000EA33B99|nr:MULTISPECIES: hypothetical protein [Clostridia]NBJ71032.1 hypothetical protein [Roseburia sp. 1XD42-34]RKI75467.1 hypothetical protein D7V87_16450 [Clostridium sp. 1xD42-85]